MFLPDYSTRTNGDPARGEAHCKLLRVQRHDPAREGKNYHIEIWSVHMIALLNPLQTSGWSPDSRSERGGSTAMTNSNAGLIAISLYAARSQHCPTAQHW